MFDWWPKYNAQLVVREHNVNLILQLHNVLKVILLIPCATSGS